jgi:hypothetical protein
LQNPDGERLRGHNPENKGIAGDLSESFLRLLHRLCQGNDGTELGWGARSDVTQGGCEFLVADFQATSSNS